MAAATKTLTLAVSCPHCMAEDATIRLDLTDLPVCVCSECEADFTPAEAVEMFAAKAARWEAVAAWVDAAPTV